MFDVTPVPLWFSIITWDNFQLKFQQKNNFLLCVRWQDILGYQPLKEVVLLKKQAELRSNVISLQHS